MMLEEVICPDCGGIVGAKSGEGRQACTCFQERLNDSFAPSPSHHEPVDAMTEPAVIEKVCRLCGKNVAGHRRFKDSLGYMCFACSEADKTHDDGLVSCGECGKRLKPLGLMDYSGTKICRSCFQDHKEMSKFQAPPPNLSIHDDRDKRSLQAMLVVAGVLGVIMLLAYFHFIGK